MKDAIDILGIVLVLGKESRYNLLHLASPDQLFCANRVLVAQGNEAGSYYYERLGLTFRFVGTMLIRTDRAVIMGGFVGNIKSNEDIQYLVLSSNGITKEYVINALNDHTIAREPICLTLFGKLGVVCREKGQNPITLFDHGELVRRVVRQSYTSNTPESSESPENNN